MKPAFDTVARLTITRAEHETFDELARRVHERSGEAAGGLRQRLLQDVRPDPSPSRRGTPPHVARHGWAAWEH